MAYKNKEDGRKQNIKYLSTESGFLICKWNDIKKRIYKKEKVERANGDYRKSAGSRKCERLEHTLTKEEFLQAWEEHKVKYGWNCYYTGKPMKIGRKLAVKGAKKRHSTPPDLLSIDRFDSNLGYTKDNIVFCRWDANDMKGSITIELCKTIYRKYLERIARPTRRLYAEGGPVTSMDFGLWERNNIRRIQKQIKEMYEKE
jgi:hypothetical protein|tara:strand:- start:326 stop:928 length:603 start_codon:yes stop_codon:yes gene_type:complete